MFLPKLYKLNSSGKIQEWSVEIENNAYRTHSGQIGGKITISEWRYAVGKNQGKANETSDNEQALKEAQSMFVSKKEQGCVEEYDKVSTASAIGFEPMLAHKYEDNIDKLKFPVYTQPKLDGMRGNFSKGIAYSRGGKTISSVPHIVEELKQIFNKYPDLVFDGELYNHEFHDDFNTLLSIFRKQKLKPIDIEKSEKYGQYWVYDIIDTDKDFVSRHNILKNLFNEFNLKYIKFVPTYVANNIDEIDKQYEQFVSDNYEGQIIRLNSLYENKRSRNLLKRKEFTTEEYVIIDIVEGQGNRSGVAGYAVMKNPKTDQTFRSNIKGTFEYCEELLNNKNKYISKLGTIQSFKTTPDGIPRFPYLIAIRDYE